MNKYLKYLTIIPGAAMLLFSIYIMGIAQDVNASDTPSVVIKIVIYAVSIIFVFVSISVILYALSYINKDKDEKDQIATSKELEHQAMKLSDKVYLASEIFGYSFWTLFILVITIVGWKSITGDMLIIMSLFWISALYTFYRLIKTIINLIKIKK